MRYATVCSGIGCPEVAWSHLGWEHAFVSEIDPFASAVLAHRFPSVPNLGDLTKIGAEHGPVDLLCGGTPCQSFSVAGRRAGLDDPRGVLAFEFLRLADRLRARWLVFENVPGFLSIDGGRAFGAFAGGLAKLGYGWAMRVLDAQWFGVAQRRARVFVVAHLGDWRGPVAVLLEPEGLRGDPAPCREEGEGVAPTLANRARGGGGLGTDAECDGALIAHTLKAEGADASEDGTGRGVPLAVKRSKIAADWEEDIRWSERQCAATLTQGAESQGKGGYAGRRREDDQNLVVAPGLTTRTGTGTGNSGMDECIVVGFHARQDPIHGPASMPLEGLPRGWTLVPYRGKPAKDGPRYRAIGNGMAVPVLRWIGERIAMWDSVA